jgi:hypothetical protein
MRIYLAICVGAIIFLSVHVCAAQSDRIISTCIEIKNGKETNNIISVDLHVYKEKKVIKWRLNEFIFTWTANNEYLIHPVEYSYDDAHSSCERSYPPVSKIEWVPGKTFKCQFEPIVYSLVSLEAESVENFDGTLSWKVRGSGNIKDCDHCAQVDYSIISFPKIILKANVLRTMNVNN